MRTRGGPPSEVRRLIGPVVWLFDGAWRGMHWWIATMAVLYAGSGITVVKPDEAALVLRWGRLVGETPALQQHGAGLLFAFPRPVDQVVRVQTKRVWETRVSTLTEGPAEGAAAPEEQEDPQVGAPNTLNPLTQGYAVTGDHNIVQVDMVARYRIRDPAAYQLYGPGADDALRAEVTAAMVRSVGEMGVDRVLSDGRKELITTASRRAQAGLDAAGSGLELSSLEVTTLAPPTSLLPDFSAVQSAFIEAETKKKNAQAYAESAVPRASAEVDAAVQAARAAAAADLAQARGDGDAFRALEKEYRANPVVVRERLYRDAVEHAISAGTVEWIPPPVGGSYHGMRITIPAAKATPAPAGEPEPS